MSGPVDLQALFAGGELDPEMIHNLKQANLDEMRQLLLDHFPDAEVDLMMERIRKLRDLDVPLPT